MDFLPKELLDHILHLLDGNTLLCAKHVCKKMSSLIESQESLQLKIYRYYCMRHCEMCKEDPNTRRFSSKMLQSHLRQLIYGEIEYKDSEVLEYIETPLNISYDHLNLKEELQRSITEETSVLTRSQHILYTKLRENNNILVECNQSAYLHALAISILQLLKPNKKAIVLTHSKDYAVKMKSEFENLGKYSELKTDVIFAVHPKKLADTLNSLNIIICLPLKLKVLIENNFINLKDIQILASGLSTDFWDQIGPLLSDRLSHVQSIFLTARILSYLQNNHLPQYLKIKIKPPLPLYEGSFSYLYYEGDPQEGPIKALLQFLTAGTKTVIYCNSQQRAEMLANKLQIPGIELFSPLYSAQIFRKFTTGASSILISGISEIEEFRSTVGICNYVHYDFPNLPEELAERSGGYDQSTIISNIFLVCSKEGLLKLHEIAAWFNVKINRVNKI